MFLFCRIIRIGITARIWLFHYKYRCCSRQQVDSRWRKLRCITLSRHIYFRNCRCTVSSPLEYYSACIRRSERGTSKLCWSCARCPSHSVKSGKLPGYGWYKAVFRYIEQSWRTSRRKSMGDGWGKMEESVKSDSDERIHHASDSNSGQAAGIVCINCNGVIT